MLFSSTGNMKEFKQFVMSDSGVQSKVADLRARVEKFATGFDMPGFEER